MFQLSAMCNESELIHGAPLEVPTYMYIYIDMLR